MNPAIVTIDILPKWSNSVAKNLFMKATTTTAAFQSYMMAIADKFLHTSVSSTAEQMLQYRISRSSCEERCFFQVWYLAHFQGQNTQGSDWS